MEHDRRLLVLDDDLTICQTIQSIAEFSGIQVRVTTSHREFFFQVEDWQPTHIALDLVMPEMDGVQVLGELADKKCNAGIIITSGIGNRVLDAAGRSAAERGLIIIGVLSKPFSPKTLRSFLSVPLDAVETVRGANPAAPAPTRSFIVTEAELNRALENHDLEVYFQPKVFCADGKLAGFEALVRWQHPVEGLIMPDRFIAFAEAHGLIDRLTNQVFDDALEWFSNYFPTAGIDLSVNLSAATIADLAMSMDISTTSLRDEWFLERMAVACEQRRIDPSRMIFELTETSAMKDPTVSLALLTRLRMKGFQLSIDDFGTGYSSMVQLVRLPFSEIKVDRTFVNTALTSAEFRSVVQCIVDLGQSLGLKTTAEGVEDKATFNFLRDIGCDLAQGYFISRPMRGDAAWHWVQQQSL